MSIRHSFIAQTSERMKRQVIRSEDITSDQIIAKDFRTARNIGQAGGGAGIRITANEIAGYSAGTTVQFKVRASDGKAEFGGGNVLLDATGIRISGDTYLRFEAATYHTIVMSNRNTGVFRVEDLADKTSAPTILELADGFDTIRNEASSMFLRPSTGTASGVLVHQVRSGGISRADVDSTADNNGADLGLSSFRWREAHITRLISLRERTAAPALADMQVGEIWIGQVGDLATSGRIWIKPNSGEIFEFQSTGRIT